MKNIEGVLKKILVTHEGERISEEVSKGEITFEGLKGDCHYGLTLLTHGREPEYPKGTLIRNNRQITILSLEELNEIAKILDIPNVDISWLAGNLLVSGVKNLSLLPYGARFIFSNGVVLTAGGENFPCSAPAKTTQSFYPAKEGITREFVKAAMHRRGIIAWVERPGIITPEESFRIENPEPWNPVWTHELG